LPFKEKHVLSLSKGDSRKARLLTAERLINAFAQNQKSKDQSKIKSTPPQSSPALRAREEAGAGAKSKWIPACAGMTIRLSADTNLC
jgi:hypothetical protein